MDRTYTEIKTEEFRTLTTDEIDHVAGGMVRPHNKKQAFNFAQANASASAFGGKKANIAVAETATKTTPHSAQAAASSLSVTA